MNLLQRFGLVIIFMGMTGGIVTDLGTSDLGCVIVWAHIVVGGLLFIFGKKGDR